MTVVCYVQCMQAALELMKHIPRETNNIICMSLIRGVHRFTLLGHGSLWLQVKSETLVLPHFGLL